MRLYETLAQYTTEAEHGIQWFPLIIEFAIAALFLLATIWGLNALLAIYGVWRAHKEGEAELALARNEQLSLIHI